MSLYSRPQLWVLLAIVALGGLGVAIGEWRHAHPGVADRIEGFDAEPVPGAGAPPGPRAGAALGPAAGSSVVASRAPIGRPARTDHVAEAGTRPKRAQSFRVARQSKRQPSEGPLDLNRATIEDLKRLPGVGPGLAQRIVAAREETGPFTSVDDLKAVPGVGGVRLARLRDLVTVSR